MDWLDPSFHFYFFFIWTSGARYAGVPTRDFLKDFLPMMRAKPKSPSLTLWMYFYNILHVLFIFWNKCYCSIFVNFLNRLFRKDKITSLNTLHLINYWTWVLSLTSNRGFAQLKIFVVWSHVTVKQCTETINVFFLKLLYIIPCVNMIQIQVFIELTCGNSASEERRTFSGLRSQWTMFIVWRCFKATRICVTRNLVVLSDNLDCSLERIISSISPK